MCVCVYTRYDRIRTADFVQLNGAQGTHDDRTHNCGKLKLGVNSGITALISAAALFFRDRYKKILSPVRVGGSPLSRRETEPCINYHYNIAITIG